MRYYIIYFILFFTTCSLFADFSFQDILEDYTRFEEITQKRPVSLNNFNTDIFYMGDYNYWDTLSLSNSVFQSNLLSVSIFSPQVFFSYNENSAFGGGDRIAFQGRGANTSLIGGIQLDSKYLSINLIPELFFSENRKFDIVETSNSSGYGDYWTVFDNLQRFGDDSYTEFSWGQSSIKLNYFNIALSLGTENITTGFSKRNSFLLSENASGFLHVDLGTYEKLHIKYVGDIEVKMLWGVIEESDYFNDDTTDDEGWLSGLFVGYSPFFTENLMFGFNHLYTKPISEWTTKDLAAGIPGVDSINTPGADGDNDMMISIAYRWVFPTVGLDLYGEWARNDNFSNFMDLYNFPEHTQGYTIGLSKVLAEINRYNTLLFSLEYSNSMQQKSGYFSGSERPAGPWYRHAWAGWEQGYTNKGQVIGLAIGPGSESLWLEVKYLFKKGSIGINVERVVKDKDYYWLLNAKVNSDDYGVNSQFNLGGDVFYYLDDFMFYFKYIINVNANMNFESLNKVYNPHLELGLNYNF